MSRSTVELSWMPLLVLLAAAAAVVDGGGASKKVLSFGGNGMIGSEVIKMMAEEGGYDITMVSRGNWHFDAEKRVKPHVTPVHCDRAKEAACAAEKECDINTLKNCTELMKIVNATDKFDVVLDFSAYEPKWVHDAIGILGGKIDKDNGVYIYVSSDSIYEVCEGKTSARRTVESDAKRPADVKARKHLKTGDEYGDAKLSGEEALQDQREAGGFPWVALRFSDVIGPRDTTHRWYIYQYWLKFYHDIKRPVLVPPIVESVRETLTYVKDAAASVMLAAKAEPKAWNQAYNIAMDDDTTLWEIVQRMARLMAVDNIEQDNDPKKGKQQDFYMFPTVFSGPISSQKAKDVLGFKPTSMDDAFRDTIEWYDALFVEDESEREEMLKNFIGNVVPREKKDKFYAAVAKELEEHGVVNAQLRKKRKGDSGGLDDDEEGERDEL